MVVNALLEHEKLQTVLVRVHKPFAPIPGILKDVAVEVLRKR